MATYLLIISVPILGIWAAALIRDDEIGPMPHLKRTYRTLRRLARPYLLTVSGIIRTFLL